MPTGFTRILLYHGFPIARSNNESAIQHKYPIPLVYSMVSAALVLALELLASCK